MARQPYLKDTLLRAGVAASLALASLGARAATAQTDTAAARMPVQPLPTRLSDAEFWQLESTFSEPGGYFQSDNWTSNEIEVSQLATMLRTSGHAGGTYLGVGPEQNFSYIAAIHPEIVFLFDIRRQAILQHLMYKAIFELSPTRVDFLSLLFNKPRQAGLDTTSSIQDIWRKYWYATTDTSTYQANLQRIKDQLLKVHGLQLSPEDVQIVELVYHTFYWLGPSLTYGGTTGGGGNQVNFGDLTSSVDANGLPQSFLADEAHYRVVRDLHLKNLIIPVVGDFAGPKAIRSVGDYLRAHGTTVTAFYVSNVEQYLFQNGVATNFYQNVATLPMDSTGVFIRPYALRRGPAEVGLCPIAGFVAAAQSGRVYDYNATLACVR